MTAPASDEGNQQAMTPDPSTARELPRTAAGQETHTLLHRLSSQMKTCEMVPCPFAGLARRTEIEGAQKESVVARIHYGDPDDRARSYNLGYDDAVEHYLQDENTREELAEALFNTRPFRDDSGSYEAESAALLAALLQRHISLQEQKR